MANSDFVQLLIEIYTYLSETLDNENISSISNDIRENLLDKISVHIPNEDLPQNSDLIFNENEMQDEWSNIYEPNPFSSKSSLKDLSPHIKYHGTIEKLGGLNGRSWQKRYCVLASNYLYFFENARSKKQNNQIYIPNFTFNAVKERGNVKNYLAFRLKTKMDGKCYYFRVSDKDEYLKWEEYLSQAQESQLSPDNNSAKVILSVVVDHPPIIEDRPEPPPIETLPNSLSFNEQSTLVKNVPLTLNCAIPPSISMPVIYLQELHETQIKDKNALDPPPPPPVRAGSILTGSGGVSVKEFRNLRKSNIPKLNQDIEEDINEPFLEIDTIKIYNTDEKELFPYDKIFVALWKFRGTEPDELSLRRGDLLLVGDNDPSCSWWIGHMLDSETLKLKDITGMFPKQYVENAFIRIEA